MGHPKMTRGRAERKGEEKRTDLNFEESFKRKLRGERKFGAPIDVRRLPILLLSSLEFEKTIRQCIGL